MKSIVSICSAIIMVWLVLVGCGQEHTERSFQQANTGTRVSSSIAHTTVTVEEKGVYTDKDHVAAYIHQYKKLPSNYITKQEAKKLGWKVNGSLDEVAPCKSIGGDRFANYEKVVPDKKGRFWKEADIAYQKGTRNGKRIVFSNDGLIYYSEDHYKSFEKLY